MNIFSKITSIELLGFDYCLEYISRGHIKLSAGKKKNVLVKSYINMVDR